MISEITLLELSKCPEPKQSELLYALQEIDYELLEQTLEITELAQQYMLYGVLPEKSRVDCLHIAAATVNSCPYIVSWNFKHFVNIRTINKVQAVNKLLGYPDVYIIPPPMLLEGVELSDKQ